MYLTGFKTEQEALDESEALAIAAGIVPSGSNITKYMFSVVELKSHGFALSVKKRDTNRLSSNQRSKLEAYLPIKDHGPEMEPDIKWVVIEKENYSFINFASILDIPESIKTKKNGDYLVSYNGSQPLFVFKITKDAIGLPEKIYSEVSGELFKE